MTTRQKFRTADIGNTHEPREAGKDITIEHTIPRTIVYFVRQAQQSIESIKSIVVSSINQIFKQTYESIS